MQLWLLWWSLVEQLRPACTRTRTFCWLAVTLAALSVRSDLQGGVSSCVRALGLQSRTYLRLLAFFHSSALCPDHLARVWTALVLRVHPGVHRVNGFLVVLADGLKKAKCGRKMPGVKSLHQVSDQNTKPEFIMGHSCQALALLCRVAGSFQAVPLCARIHEGLVFSNRDRRTLLDKLLLLLQSLRLPEPVLLVADAYYACGKIVRGLIAQGGHLISRLKKNATAYELPPVVAKPRRGRPRRYGQKIKLVGLFAGPLLSMPSPAYDEHGIILQYCVRDLLWRPVGALVRIVAVIHPVRGRILLLSTNLTFSAEQIIATYSLRFKIELTFKHALHLIGAWSYRFWMRAMIPLRRGSGDQFLHRRSDSYRHAIRRKLTAYHRYLQVALVAQGLMLCLSALAPKLVWAHFGSWLRTVRQPGAPSEFVVAAALRFSLGDFLAAAPTERNLTKFLRTIIDFRRSEGARLAA